MKKRAAALVVAGAMAFSTLMPGLQVLAAEPTGFIGDASLTDAVVAAPARDTVVPDANQYEYQKQELAAFCHFGPNTFNEIEWGEHYGDRAPSNIFTLDKNFDADTLVSALKDAGFKKLIVTAKHHDGFCIFNSDYTTYDVESTNYAKHNYDGLGGDILAEISAACTAHDMDMGLYLSPWDIHDPSYGYYDANHRPTDREHDVLDYNDYYNNQLVEILSDPIYGNNGHFKEVWMDGAKGSGANAQDYDFQRWFATIQKYEGKQAGYDADCMLFGAEAYSTVRWIGNENGYANEETWSKSIVDKKANTIDSNRTGVDNTFVGYENGNQWTVPEVDARITSGWFWGTTKNIPKSLLELGNMYFNSVGHNAPLLLNIPPNNQGTVDEAILNRVHEFGDNISTTFQRNLAAGAVVSADQVRGNALSYKPGNVLDGLDNTYWTVDDGSNTGTLLLDLGQAKTFDVVSIEESIEFGQRIKNFKVEYSLNNGEWKTFEEGTTIGAKRLCRKAAVKADKVRITVTTTSAVPMISEVGLYKASEGFEKAKAAPSGMDVLDIHDEKAFQLTGWNKETGEQYLNGTNAWANPGGKLTLNFNGSKVYLIGTIDPNHGTANVSIDGQPATEINTNAAARKVGQMLYISEDLADGAHTLTLDVTNRAIGIEAAYVINNGGMGMIGIEQPSYTMNEDSTQEIKLVRVGGTKGDVTVNFAPNPGSAIQDDYNTECNYNLTFADGVAEPKMVTVQTRRNTKHTGSQYFTVALSSNNEGLILGFNDVARINILDAEEEAVRQLRQLVDECSALNPANYKADSWTAFAKALEDAKNLLAQDNAGNDALVQAKNTLQQAKDALVVRTAYTAEDRFLFPAETDASSVMEAEMLELHNNTEGDNGWPMKVAENSWASNGKYLDSMNGNDVAKLYYHADKAGAYKAVVTYRSGDPTNSIVWDDANGKIFASEVTAGASDEARATHTAVFRFTVKLPGDGVLSFKGGARKAPQIDKIVFTRLDENAPADPTDRSLDYQGVTPTAGHVHSSGPVNNVTDYAANTFWSTGWGQDDGQNVNKRWVQLDLGEKKLISGLRVLPRQGDMQTEGGANGTPTKYKIQISDDGNVWTDVVTAERPANSQGWRDWYIIDFGRNVEARYVRYNGLETYPDSCQMALAELHALMPAPEPVPAGVVAVIEQIDALGEITLAKEADVKAARAAFNALPADQQAMVENAAKLTEAEAALSTMYELKGASLSVGGNVAVNFFFNLSEEMHQNAKVVLTVEDGKTVTLPAAEAVQTDNGYRFTASVPVRQMRNPITIQVMKNGEEIGVKEFSVRNYADIILGDTENQYPDTVKAFVKAMLFHGSAMQTYKGYTRYGLADADLDVTALQQAAAAITAADLSAYQPTVTGKAEGLTLHGVNLNLMDETALRFYFTKEAGIKADQFTFDTGAYTHTVTENDTMICVEVADIAASHLDEAVTLKVGGLTVTYSPLSYARSVILEEKADTLDAVARSLVVYNRAGNALNP